MRINKWTVGLAAAGLVSLPAVMQAEEKMNQVWTALSSTTISGYVDTSAQWNTGTGNLVPAYAFNQGKQDGFNLDVVKLTIERPLDEGQWAAGYKVDLLFGPDADMFGTQSINSDGSGDFGVKQAYVALRAPVGNGLDFKVGVFDTIIGYEVFESGHNPNFSRSYGWTIEPVSHTGALMTYQFAEWFSAAAGVANTTGPVINSKAHQTNIDPAAGTYYSESYKTYMGSIALTAPEDMGFLAGSTLYAGVINGFNEGVDPDQGGPQAASTPTTSWYIGATMATPIEGLRLGASYDYFGYSSKNYTGPDRPAGYANATALYASMQLSEKLSLHGRGEYFSQTDSAATVGLPTKVVAFTATAQYDLWKNVISRLEFRWDHQADGEGHAYGQPDANDPVGGDLRNAYMIAANFIYTF